MTDAQDGLLYIIVMQALPPPLEAKPDASGVALITIGERPTYDAKKPGNDIGQDIRAYWKVFDDWEKANVKADELAAQTNSVCRIMGFPDFRVTT